MCERLSELRDSLERFATEFDASLLSGADAVLVVHTAAAVERMAATVKGLAAVRAAETGEWRGAGDRSAAHHLARLTGTAVSHAAEVIETARRLHDLPDVVAAARSGALSPQQASAIADAACAAPGVAAQLVAKAQASSLAELRAECVRAKVAARPDPEAQRSAIHAARYLRTYCDAEGAWNLRMRDNPEVGAEVMAALGPIRDRLFRAARATAQHEPSEAYAADALVELARGDGAEPGARRAAAKVIVRVDLPTLLRGRAATGEVCELAGFGPVAVSAVRDLMDTGDPFLAAVVTNGARVVGVAHLGRRANARQQTALEWLYPTCAVEGCAAAAHLETDHRLDWAKSHTTIVDLLDRLCTHHHDLKSQEGWALVAGEGKRRFVPPDDPEHPRRTKDPPWAA